MVSLQLAVSPSALRSTPLPCCAAAAVNCTSVTQPLSDGLDTAMVLAVGLYFFNFVTFSTKHGSASDKAYSRLLGSRYPMLIAGCEAIFEFLLEKLQQLSFIY